MVLRCRMVIVSDTDGRALPVSSTTVRSMSSDDHLALVLATVDEEPAWVSGT